MNGDGAELLSVKDVMLLLGVGRSTLYRSLSAGEFPKPVRAVGSRVKWRRADLTRYIEKLKPRPIRRPNVPDSSAS